MGRAAMHQQVSLLHWLSSTTMDLAYTSSFRGMEEHYSFFFREHSTPSDTSPGYSCQVHDGHCCHPMVNTQGDWTRSPFMHLPPSLMGWPLSPPSQGWGCLWGSSTSSLAGLWYSQLWLYLVLQCSLSTEASPEGLPDLLFSHPL